MKSKKSRILGVALTLAMLASLLVFAAPVAAQPGEGMWAAQTIPTATDLVIQNNNDVGDVAVSGDGTIYVINNDDAMFANLAASVLKSTDGGNTFTACTAVGGSATDFLTSIAVAPDDSDAVMVTDNVTAFVSKDGGTTWTALPAKNTAGDILDCDVSPAVTGAIVDRHYVIAIADPTIGVTGRAEIYGPGATWSVITQVNAAAPAADYMAAKFSPGYVGDRFLALVYNLGAITELTIISQPGETAAAEVRAGGNAIGTTSTDYDRVTNTANRQLALDIAMPSNWDPSLAAGEVTYVSVASDTAATAFGVAGRGGAVAATTGHATDDVYRIDAGVPVDLNGSNTVPVHSVAYSGTIDDGTLYLGTRLAPNVRYTINPTSMSPTWKTTQKAPTGDNIALPEACTRVVVGPDGTIYAGTRDSWTVASAVADRRSAFSRSDDLGFSFYQTALIDVAKATVDLIDSVMLTPDGLTVFMATDDTVDLSLWTSSTPADSDTWSRICTRTAVGPGLIRLPSDWGDNPSLFWFNQAAANLWVSHDGGAVFYNRTPPATPVDMVAQSGGGTGVLYMSNAGNIYRSDNGGMHFAVGPVAVGAGAIISLSTAPSYPAAAEAGNLVVGGTGAIAYSTNSGVSFTLAASGLVAASTYVVCADEAFATAGADGENMLYAGDASVAGGATGNTLRYQIGVSSQWDDLISAAAAANEVLGIAINNGVLYSLSAANYGVERTLYPLDPLGTITWSTGNTGSANPGAVTAVSPNILTVVDNFLYFPDRTVGTPVLWALEDTTATVIPVINVPADETSIDVDPVTGRGVLTTVLWDAIGSGGGLVNRWELEAGETTVGWIATTQAAAPPAAATLVGEPTAPSLTVGTAVALATGSRPTWAANETYMLRIRARSVINNAAGVGGLISHWSEPVTVYLSAGGVVVLPQYGPQLQGPTGGATDVSLNPGFAWAPVFGATEYEFVLALDALLTDTVEGTPVLVTDPAWLVPPGTLLPDTQYFWGVKATQPTQSPQSIGTFRTIAPDVFTCPICGDTFTTAGALDSHIAAIHPAGTPAYMWAIIVIGAVLMIAVIMLIMKTRRVT